MQQLGSHWTVFHEIWHFSTFHKSVEKVQISLKSDKTNGYFTQMQNTFKTASLRILPKTRNIYTKAVEKSKARNIFQ